MNAGIWLASALAICASGGLARSQYERGRFVVEKNKIQSPQVKRPRTLVFLTDLHDKEFGEGNNRLLSAIRRIHPDMVLIGGDTMIVKEGMAKLDVTKRLLAGLVSICPVYYGNGNHEQRMWQKKSLYGNMYQDFRKLLQKFAVTYLSDSFVDVDEDIRISGLNIHQSFYKDLFPAKMSPEYIQAHLGAANTKRYQILLAHSPLFLNAYAEWGADLVLSGHFHGGTVRIPGLGGVMTPQYQFFMPYCAGVFEREGCCMIVGRGLGTHSINIRFCNKPQVVVVELQPAFAAVRSEHGRQKFRTEWDGKKDGSED